MIALSTGDVLWIWPSFNEQPVEIVVHCYGRDLHLSPGSEHFAALTRMLNQNLSGPKRWDQLTMSQETYRDYRTSPNMMALEITYPAPVRVHSIYKFFSQVSTLVIPLDGRHAQTNAVFGLNRGVTTSGSLHVESIAPLAEYLRAENLCQKP